MSSWDLGCIGIELFDPGVQGEVVNDGSIGVHRGHSVVTAGSSPGNELACTESARHPGSEISGGLPERPFQGLDVKDVDGAKVRLGIERAAKEHDLGTVGRYNKWIQEVLWFREWKGLCFCWQAGTKANYTSCVAEQKG